MYEKTICKVSEVFFLQYLNLCTMALQELWITRKQLNKIHVTERHKMVK